MNWIFQSEDLISIKYLVDGFEVWENKGGLFRDEYRYFIKARNNLPLEFIDFEHKEELLPILETLKVEREIFLEELRSARGPIEKKKKTPYKPKPKKARHNFGISLY